MNRRKKINQVLKARAKKSKPKVSQNKPKYISKADRAKLALEPNLEEASFQNTLMRFRLELVSNPYKLQQIPGRFHRRLCWVITCGVTP